MTRGLLMINRRKSHINVKSKIVSRIGFSLFIILMILAGTLCGCIDNQGLVKDAIPTQTDSTNGELIHIASGKSNEARLQSEEPKLVKRIHLQMKVKKTLYLAKVKLQPVQVQRQR